MKKFKEIFIAAGTLLSSCLGILYIPVMMLVCCNIIDYATGLCAAKYRSETVNSYKSVKGIAKKICMWLLVAIGAMLDILLCYAADTVGISADIDFIVSSAAAVWLTANEIISILENIRDIGAPLPPFILKIAENVRSESEKKGGKHE